jgi:hypothetical protein
LNDLATEMRASSQKLTRVHEWADEILPLQRKQAV